MIHVSSQFCLVCIQAFLFDNSVMRNTAYVTNIVMTLSCKSLGDRTKVTCLYSSDITHSYHDQRILAIETPPPLIVSIQSCFIVSEQWMEQCMETMTDHMWDRNHIRMKALVLTHLFLLREEQTANEMCRIIRISCSLASIISSFKRSP
jgi:hypothetical protein